MAQQSNQERKRLFVAVDMPQTIIDEVIKIQRELQRKQLFEGHYTTPDNMHMTLKFLGEVDATVASTIGQALRSISLTSFQAKLGLLDVFYSGRRIKIIFVRVIAPEFAQLAAQLDDALADMFASEDRAFVSHLTVARVKQVPDNHVLLTELNAIAVQPLEFMVTEFVLKESVLVQEGAQHSIVERYQLDGVV